MRVRKNVGTISPEGRVAGAIGGFAPVLVTVLRSSRASCMSVSQNICANLFPNCDSFWGCFVNPYIQKTIIVTAGGEHYSIGEDRSL